MSSFLKDETGSTAVEYAIALIGATAIILAVLFVISLVIIAGATLSSLVIP